MKLINMKLSKACIIFSMLILIILVSYPYVYGEQKPQKTEIELIKEDFNRLESKVEKILLSLDKRDKEVDRFKDCIVDFERVLSAKQFDLSRSILSCIAWGIAIAVGLGTLLTWVGFPYVKEIASSRLRKAVEDLRNEIKDEIRKDSAEAIKELEKEGLKLRDELIFTNSLNLGYLYWTQNRIGEAIYNTETALQKTVANEKNLLIAKSNLGFYLAMEGKKENKERAIALAKESMDMAEKYQRQSWLANYGYVRMKYSENCREIREIIPLLEELLRKEEIKEEIEGYLQEAREKEKVLCKNI